MPIPWGNKGEMYYAEGEAMSMAAVQYQRGYERGVVHTFGTLDTLRTRTEIIETKLDRILAALETIMDITSPGSKQP